LPGTQNIYAKEPVQLKTFLEYLQIGRALFGGGGVGLGRVNRKNKVK
jgi:hypothetical protein